MLPFLAILGYIVTIIVGSISIYEFIRKKGAPGAVFAVVAVGMLITSLVLTSLTTQKEAGANIPPTPTPTTNETVQGNTNSTVIPQTPSPTATPSPVPLPKPGTVLYQNDQSWQNWNANGWSVLNGDLITSQGSQDSQTIMAPYHPGENNVSDYSVTVIMTIVKYNNCYRCGLGIVVRANVDDPNSGYTLSSCAVAGLQTCNQDNEDNYLAFLLAGQNFPDGGTVLAQTHFQPIEGKQHTYRLDCKGGTITGYIDGNPILGPKQDFTTLSGGNVLIYAYNVQLSVSSVTITAL
jgi:hypothetical protein